MTFFAYLQILAVTDLALDAVQDHIALRRVFVNDIALGLGRAVSVAILGITCQILLRRDEMTVIRTRRLAEFDIAARAGDNDGRDNDDPGDKNDQKGHHLALSLTA